MKILYLQYIEKYHKQECNRKSNINFIATTMGNSEICNMFKHIISYLDEKLFHPHKSDDVL